MHNVLITENNCDADTLICGDLMCYCRSSTQINKNCDQSGLCTDNHSSYSVYRSKSMSQNKSLSIKG